MWIYGVKQHAMIRGDKRRTDLYSGHDPWRDNPLAVHVHDLGPIPPGAYNLGTVEESGAHGPLAIHLLPCSGTEMFGRSGFLVHGDSIAHPGDASHGCVIAPRELREQMAQGTDRLLVVIADLDTLRVAA